MKSGVALVKLLLAFVILLTTIMPRGAGRMKNDELPNGKFQFNSNNNGNLRQGVFKNLKRVRKDMVNGKMNLSEQTIQCEIPSLSCRNCCENSINCTHNATFCRCDSQCTFYNDCCVDYETFCRREENLSFGVDPLGLSCTNVKNVKMKIESNMVWIINKCPRNRKSDEISYNCENADELKLNVSNIQHLVPVVSKNLIFRNEFCAKCNGIEQFESFGFDIRCYANLPSPISIGTFAELTKFAFKYCEPSKHISIFRKDDQAMRQCNQYFRHLCPTMKELSKKCNRLSNNDCISATHWCNLNLSKWDDKVDEKCEELMNSAKLTDTSRRYDVLSHATTLTAKVKQPTPYIPSYQKIEKSRLYVTLRTQVTRELFYITSLFYHTKTTFEIQVIRAPDLYEIRPQVTEVKKVSETLSVSFEPEPVEIRLCPEEKFYDQFLDICRDGVIMPLMKENLDKFYVAMWLDLSGIPPSRDEIILSFAQLFNFQRSQVNGLRIDNTSSTWGASSWIIHFELSLTNEQTLLLAKDNYTTTNNSVWEIEGDSRNFTRGLPLQRLLFFSRSFNVTITNRTYTVFRTTSRQLACIRKRTFLAGTYTSLQNGNYYYINSTGESFARERVFFEETNISVCGQIVFSTCVGRQLVNLTSDEYVKFENLSIFYNRTNTIYDFGEYDIKDGQIFMCIPEGFSKYFVSDLSNSVIQENLTLTCFVLSLTCLFVVIQTYLIFAELRNLPGKNLLSLSVSLFLTQLLWLISDKWYPYTLCHVIAATEHYFFLVSFVAMATIAWDTHSGFSSKNVRNNSPNNRDEILKKFYKYSAIVWGLPAMFVVACAVVDILDVYAVYVNERMCWFDNTQAQQYLFVLPVALLLLFNLTFFALTVFRIQRFRASTRLVHSDRNRRKMFWIYLKISSLMGFSWLFGFIDLFTKSTQVFSYLFTVFASLQGVYIALAFVVKKEVWEKYKKLFARISERFKADNTNKIMENQPNSKETRV